jgi:hypothetical protein
MRSGENICSLWMGPAFAGWTLSGFTVARQVGRIHSLGGVSILAFFFSILSPNDGGFQQELIRLSNPFVRVSAHTRVALRRWLASLPLKVFIEAGDLIGVSRMGTCLSWTGLLSPKQKRNETITHPNQPQLPFCPVRIAARGL